MSEIEDADKASDTHRRWHVVILAAGVTVACGGGASATGETGSARTDGSPDDGDPGRSGESVDAGSTGAGGAPHYVDAAGAPDVGKDGNVGDSRMEIAESGWIDRSDAPQPVEAAGDELEGGSPCAGVFCEDFERGSIDPSIWISQTMGGATVVLQQQNAAHGKYAAQFHGLAAPSGGATTAYAYLIAKNIPAALRVHQFGRAYFLITPKPRSNNLGMVFGGTQGFPRPTYMSIASHNGGWQFGFVKLQGSPGGEVQSQPSGQMPVAAWTCLEWEFNDQPDQIHVWGDGTSIGTLDSDHVDYPPGHVPGTPLFDGMSSGLIGGFVDVGFGIYDWHPAGVAFDVYYDDIVLDTKRVGCM